MTPRAYVPPPGSIPTLPVPDLRTVAAVHLVGIGGAGMSGIGRLLLARGVRVSGSDLKESRSVAQLRALGAQVSIGHRSEHVDGADAVVRSSAVAPDNPELREAAARGIPILARAQVMAALMREHRSVAVAGTHGKTSTTSMLAVILERTGRDPTYLIGGDLNESGSNARSGGGDIFVAEADESDGSFLLLDPEVAVITNVEADHLDFYPGIEEVEGAFAAFCRRAGLVVACADDPGVRRVLAACDRVAAVTYGASEDADVRVEVRAPRSGGATGLVREGGLSAEVVLGIPGTHHLLNAAAAVTAAGRMGVSLAQAAEALRGFTGVRRRFERRGEVAGAAFVDDYAHHPTEVAATLGAARELGRRRLVAVFQPHRYSRTAAMWRSLGESLAGADLVVLTDVYGAGETPVPGVTGKLLVDALLETAPSARVVYLPHRSDLARFLAAEARPGDLVLTLGAGDITAVSDETLALLGGHGRASA